MRINAIPSFRYGINNSLAEQNVKFGNNQLRGGSFFNPVDEYLYRGRMPYDSSELKELKDFGISTIVDLTHETQYNPENVKLLGMKYYNLGFDYEPSVKIIDFFFNIANEVRKNKGKMFVHCMYGQDRTGLMVNLYKLYNKMPVSDNFETYYAQKTFDNYIKSIGHVIK